MHDMPENWTRLISIVRKEQSRTFTRDAIRLGEINSNNIKPHLSILHKEGIIID